MKKVPATYLFTPKSLLRDSRCVSTIEEFENGSFQETIDDDAVNKACENFSFLYCKFYYELTAEREKMNVKTYE
jgi:2-oxoglutarate dehydrogenase E1 component